MSKELSEIIVNKGRISSVICKGILAEIYVVIQKDITERIPKERYRKKNLESLKLRIILGELWRNF